MKKIMKKALSLALALVMMLSLAPVTAQAAGAGTENDPIVLENATTTITSDGTGSAVYYLYNAPVAADYVITVTGETDSFGYSMIHPMTGSPISNYAYNGELVMYADQTDEVAFNMFDETSQELTITITMTEGTEVDNSGNTGATGETPEDAIALTADSPYVTLPGGGSMTYCKVAVEAGEGYTLNISSRVMADFDLYTYNPMTGQYGYNTWAENSVIETEVAPDSTEYIFAIGNPGDLEVSVMVTMTKVGSEDTGSTNSMDNPEVITEMGTYNSTMPAGEYSYWYKWEASQAGVLTVTTTNEGGYTGFIVNDSWECTTEALDNGGKVMVAAGDTVVFYVSPAGASTVNMTASFEVGAKIEQVEDPTDEEESNFEKGDAIVVGDNELAGPSSYLYTYTVHEFAPGETGKYTFTTTDSAIGIVSNNGMWITVKLPDADAVDTNNVPYTAVVEDEIVWECTDANQSIWIAVMPNANSANVKVVKEELVIKEVPQTVYPASADAYVFTGDASAIEYVDVQGATTDTAVLGDDGFYHLNDKTGPILLVNLDDSIMTFVVEGNLTIGNIAVATYDANGEVVATTAYGSYIEACIANADSVTHPDFGDVLLYPLTEGLMEVYKTYGAQQGWYNTSMGGQVIGQFNGKYNEEDIWMFACMYVPNAEDGTIEVPPVAIKPDAIVDEEGKVTGYEPVKEEAVKAAIDKAVAENRDLVVETTADGVLMTFAAEDLKDAKAVALNIEVALKNDVKDETVAKNDKITDKNFVMKVEFSHEGNLPTTATITIPVSADFAGKTLYYYEILTDGTLKFVCEAPVDANGVASVAQDHCSDYVLLTERVDVVEPETTPGNPTTGAADPETSTTPNGTPTTTSPKTGDDTNIALWVAVLGLGVVAIAGSVVMRKREF